MGVVVKEKKDQTRKGAGVVVRERKEYQTRLGVGDIKLLSKLECLRLLELLRLRIAFAPSQID